MDYLLWHKKEHAGKCTVSICEDIKMGQSRDYNLSKVTLMGFSGGAKRWRTVSNKVASSSLMIVFFIGNAPVSSM
ncbi:hypothetical protein A1D23_08140 [Chelonobacter oris]|nr:hypothetical protein [Chelonobacter oris]